MSAKDREHWDRKYSSGEPESADQNQQQEATAPPALPHVFVPNHDVFPASGSALEIACGRGRASVWLALRGMNVTGLDISPVAIAAATSLAADYGVTKRCTFQAFDLDHGLPKETTDLGARPTYDLVVCHLFRAPALDQQLIDALRPGGLLAMATLSEVGAKPGRFRAKRGELTSAFSSLGIIASGEGEGTAWILARTAGSTAKGN